MSLAANAPHAFAIRNIETGAIRDERFTRNSAASKASWLLGGDKDGLDHDVVGLDREGAKQHPSRFSSAIFDLEILDTATGAMVRCAWADEEAYRRSLDRPTVADRGVW